MPVCDVSESHGMGWCAALFGNPFQFPPVRTQVVLEHAEHQGQVPGTAAIVQNVAQIPAGLGDRARANIGGWRLAVMEDSIVGK